MPPLPRPTSPETRDETAPGPTDWTLVRRLIVLALRYPWLCAGVLAVQVLLLTMTLAGLGLTGLGVDYLRRQLNASTMEPRWWFGVPPPAAWSPMTVMAAIAGGIVLMVLARSGLSYLHAVWSADLFQRRAVVQLRTAVYDKLQRLSFRYFDDNESGSIINRVTSDVQSIAQFLTVVLFGVINIAVTLAVYLVYMMSIHVKLTLAVLAATPVLVVLTFFFMRLIRADMRAYHRLNDRLVLTLAESLQGMQVTKCFARQREEIDRYGRANEAVRRKQNRIFRLHSTFNPAASFLTQISTMVVLVYGGYLVVANEADPTHTAGIALGAGLFVFASLTAQFSMQVQTLANTANQAQEHLTAAARVFEILDTPLEIRSPRNPVAMPRPRGAVTLEAASFGYRPDEPVLHDIDLVVEPGQCVAILGPTGAGKSTLLSLIPRFYDPVRGRVIVDGVDVRRLDLADLRRNVGLVFQESFLFSHTIAANIAFGHPGATPAQIERAAKISCAHEFIAVLPDGYDTVIGERGVGLSGGQRQRLAIARAVLLEPPILLLDDPTAAIDPDTEHEILRAVDNAMIGRTTFVVAHRLSTLRRADYVIVMQRGRVVQTGTHETLMGDGGYYRTAADLQSADDESRRLLAAGELVMS